MTTLDYSTWLTKQQAADAIGVTTKSVERFVQAGQIQQARWQRDGRGPLLAVYHPADVDRIASARRQGSPAPFVVPAAADVPANGNGRGAGELALVPSADGTAEAVVRALGLLISKAMSETSQTSALFVTVKDASALTGLSQAYLLRKIGDLSLPAIRDRGWRIRRKDLEAL